MNKKITSFCVATSIAALTVLTGCASSSGVVRTGPDTYMIARTEERLDGSSNNVKATIIKQANEYCEKQGKVMKIISTTQKDMIPFKSDATAEVHFKCLNPDDPELKSALSEVKTPPAKEGNDSDVYAKLTKLDELRKKGVITEEEFQAEKRKLLNH